MHHPYTPPPVGAPRAADWINASPKVELHCQRGSMERIKQVILIRKDLGMRRGKEIAQGSHASMEFLVAPLRAALTTGAPALTLTLTEEERAWVTAGTAKVCLQVASEAELVAHHERALAAGLPSHLIRDSGRTEFHGQPTLTACAIGPAAVSRIDAVTGELALY
jgi:PTH2 family peptidyl-tRNA hydrolase